jgi:hypothetical protein
MVISLTWSKWIPLDADLLTYQQFIANSPGFYRVRALGSECLAYIGQTGRSLRQRTRAELAKHVMRPIESPPWNDPHTAAPLLWAFRHEDNMSFELSVTVADLPVQMRQCYEDVLLYQHRQEFGHSTLCNHGRRHPWWSRSSNRKDANANFQIATQQRGEGLPPTLSRLVHEWQRSMRSSHRMELPASSCCTSLLRCRLVREASEARRSGSDRCPVNLPTQC